MAFEKKTERKRLTVSHRVSFYKVPYPSCCRRGPGGRGSAGCGWGSWPQSAEQSGWYRMCWAEDSRLCAGNAQRAGPLHLGVRVAERQRMSGTTYMFSVYSVLLKSIFPLKNVSSLIMAAQTQVLIIQLKAALHLGLINARVLVFCILRHCHVLLTHLNETEPSIV